MSGARRSRRARSEVLTSTPSHPAASSAPENAGIGRRFACLVYEALLLLAVLFFGSAVFTGVAGSADTLASRFALQVLLLTLCGAYFVWCWTRGGQTLPMQAWHLRIVAAHSGEPPAPGLALKRYLLAVPGVLLGAVSFLWGFIDRDRLFLHDRLAGTRIVRIDRTRRTTDAPPARSSTPPQH